MAIPALWAPDKIQKLIALRLPNAPAQEKGMFKRIPVEQFPVKCPAIAPRKDSLGVKKEVIRNRKVGFQGIEGKGFTHREGFDECHSQGSILQEVSEITTVVRRFLPVELHRSEIQFPDLSPFPGTN